MKYRNSYKDPLVYWPITQLIDYGFMNRLQCPIPLFTFCLYVAILLFNRSNKQSNTGKTRTPLLIIMMGLTLLVPTLFTSLFQTQYSIVHSLDRYVSTLSIFFLILYYGKRINEKINVIIVLMFNYILVAIIFYIYKIIENSYTVDLMTLRDGLSLFGTNSFISFVFCFCLLIKSMGKLKEYHFFLVIGAVMSVIYVSRGGFAFALFLIASELSFKKNFLKKILTVSMTILIAYYILAQNPLVSERLLSGLQEVKDGTIYVENNRALIFDFSKNYLEQPQNMNVWFYGLGLDQFRYINPWGYSDPHNTLLDTIFIAGFMFFLSILFIMINIIKISRYKFTYLAFFIYVIFEGIGIIHLKGEVSSAYLLFLISLTYYFLNTSYPWSHNGRVLNTKYTKYKKGRF